MVPSPEQPSLQEKVYADYSAQSFSLADVQRDHARTLESGGTLAYALIEIERRATRLGTPNIPPDASFWACVYRDIDARGIETGGGVRFVFTSPDSAAAHIDVPVYFNDKQGIVERLGFLTDDATTVAGMVGALGLAFEIGDLPGLSPDYTTILHDPFAA